MQPDTREEALRWLAEAEEDIAVAQTLRDTQHFSRACFHAQQGAEKAMKAFLYAQGVDEPWGHSVAKLVEEAATYDADLGDFGPAGSILDRHYIPTRYPNGLPGGLPSKAYFDHDAQAAVASARQIVARIRTTIARAGPATQDDAS